MTLPVLICDDSKFARKLIASSLPDDWEIDISFAANGVEAIEAIKAGKGDVLFLDLNMPQMDGYETMAYIKKHDLPSMVIVVSGDVQEEARKRIKKLGALDFIRKPIDNDKLSEILSKYGIFSGNTNCSERTKLEDNQYGDSLDEKLDAFRELSNVAMGQAGERLAKVLDKFVELPIPNVSLIQANELAMALAAIDERQNVSAISKGFISKHIKGEAFIVFDEANVSTLSKLMGRQVENNEPSYLEVLMDVSNLIIGACLNGLSSQLDTQITHSSPMLLGMNATIRDIVDKSISRWEQVLVIEIAYAISQENIYFELLLVIPSTEVDATFKQILNTKGAAK